MDGLKDVFTPFYERLRRPFIGAYWIAVITYNWKVWTALFFYDEKVNGVDKIEYISKQLSWNNVILCPVLLALAFILLGALLDWGVFYYQEWVRSKKRYVREKFERTRMVPSETFLRVQEEKDGFKSRFTNAETEVTELKREMRNLQSSSIENRKIKLQPSEHYFQGQWTVFQPNLDEIEIEIGSSRIALNFNSKINNAINQFNPLVIKPIIRITRNNGEILILFGIQEGNAASRIKERFNSVIDIDRFTNLFSESMSHWAIPIQNIRKEDFAVNTLDGSSPVIFRRRNSWDNTMMLWNNDEDMEFPIPPSTFPKKV